MRSKAQRISARIEEDIAADIDVALRLKERLVRVFEEKVAVDLIAVARSRTAQRPVPKQDVGSGHRSRRPASSLAEYIMSNHGTHWFLWHPGWPLHLVFDLQAIPDRVFDEVVLDDATDKRCAAIGISQIHARSSATNNVPSYSPIPGRAFGRDADDLLIAAVIEDGQSLDRNIMCESGRTLCLHSIDVQTIAIKQQ